MNLVLKLVYHTQPTSPAGTLDLDLNYVGDTLTDQTYATITAADDESCSTLFVNHSMDGVQCVSVAIYVSDPAMRFHSLERVARQPYLLINLRNKIYRL